jgi:hypothetical protein
MYILFSHTYLLLAITITSYSEFLPQEGRLRHRDVSCAQNMENRIKATYKTYYHSTVLSTYKYLNITEGLRTGSLVGPGMHRNM